VKGLVREFWKEAAGGGRQNLYPLKRFWLEGAWKLRLGEKLLS
jgi:hypothetical protein